MVTCLYVIRLYNRIAFGECFGKEKQHPKETDFGIHFTILGLLILKQNTINEYPKNGCEGLYM